MKKKLIIPVVVTRTGAVQTGWASILPSENETKLPGVGQWNVAIDNLDEADFQSGIQIVHITAEIDVDALFAQNNVDGVVTIPEAGDTP